MSSMKNAMKIQKVHRERHQNEARAHLGPLEKKKDYKIRARDQEKKKILLKELHKKALDRNPDEYHLHMCDSGMQDGVHKEKAVQKKYTIKKVRADLTYIKFRRTMEQRKIEKLRSSLHFLEPSAAGEEPQNSHLLFVDTNEQARNTNAAEMLHTHPDLVGRSFNRPTMEQLQQLPDALSQQMESIKNTSSMKAKSYKELCQRLKRDDKLRALQEKLQAKLHIMLHQEQNKKRVQKQPGPKLVHRETENYGAVYKWPKIRKR